MEADESVDHLLAVPQMSSEPMQQLKLFALKGMQLSKPQQLELLPASQMLAVSQVTVLWCSAFGGWGRVGVGGDVVACLLACW